MKKKKIVIYCRVLTSEQTVENQRNELIVYAEKKGYEYDIYTETDSTQKLMPVKQELIEKLDKGEYSGVIVWKLYYWPKSDTELVSEVMELLKKGKRFISVNENLDFSTASGQLDFNTLSFLTNYTKELRSKRIIEGLNQAKKKGQKLGRQFGSKDKTKRKTTGYTSRLAKKK